MSRLLHAGIYRLRKNKVLYGCLAGVCMYCICIYISQYMNMKKSGVTYTLDSLFFNFLLLSGILVAVFVSLYVGTEYHDGTIRNKLVTGFARKKVYFSNFIVCALAGLVITTFAYIIGLLIGIPLFGSFEMPIAYLIKTCMLALLFTLAYVSIFNMISMLCTSKANSAVLCILTTFGLMIISIMLLSKLSQPEFIEQAVMVNQEIVMETVKNPIYLTGTMREIYQNILDFLPSGQMVQIINQNGMNFPRMAIYSVIIILGTNVIGIHLFQKKDIK